MNSFYPYKVLAVVAELKRISRAAEILHLTPSAVSHMIAGLEAEFGFSIFQRSRYGVELTRNGELLLPYIYSILQEHESLEQKASSIKGVQEGTVRIGGFYTVTMNWLIDIFASFHARYPHIEIEFYEGGYQDILSWIERNMVDLAFLGQAAAGSLELVPLYRDEIMCVAPLSFPLPKKGYVDVSDLADMPLIIQEQGEDFETQLILKHFPGTMKKPHFVIEDDNCIIAMVEAGLGVAFMGKLLCRKKRSENVQVLPFHPLTCRTLGLHIPRPSTLSPAAEKMRDCIFEYICDLKQTEEGVLLSRESLPFSASAATLFPKVPGSE